MCAEPYVWFARFNAIHLLFQIEKAKQTSATTVTRVNMELTGEVPSFMDGNSHYFLVVEDNNKKV